MPGCVLRVAGADFDIDRFLKTSTLCPCDVYRKGEPKGQTGRLNDKTGMNVVVSEADGNEFAQQVQDAIAFLERNKEELRRLQSCAGNEEMVLDFGIRGNEVFGQYNYLPPRLLRLAGELGMGIEVSIYK